MSGKKVNILQDNSKVSVTFVGEVKVPDIYNKEELDKIIQNKEKAGKIISSKVFTTEFESAIIFGQVKLLEEKEEKIKGLRLICEKYTPSKMEYFPIAIESGLNITNIYKIEIEEITAKRKKI